MNTASARPVPLGLTALVAFFSALAALAVTNGHTAHAHDTRQAAGVSAKELALRNGMRVLWEDHVTWTRSGSDQPRRRHARHRRDRRSAAEEPGRHRQRDEAVLRRAGGDALTAELRRHILIAADVIAAAKSGDGAKLAAEQARWQRNADDIAALLNRVNPQHWKRAAVRSMLNEHLRLTTQEVVARLQGDWTADVAAYDRIHRHALMMADTLSTGLVKQFPGRFR